MLEDRISNLEIKFSHQDDLLDQLNKIVTSQQLSIDKLEHIIQELKMSQNENSQGAERTLADDVPPHY
jgi:SlyX protein